VRPLGVTSLRRAAALPDVPTIHESGLKDFEVNVWQGIVAPARTSAGIVAQLNREIARILQAPETRERLAAQGLEASASTPERFSAYIASEYAKWSKVIRHAGITAE
jgi:tripartite-type tricarboxylate transporter receptor subunit TctC